MKEKWLPVQAVHMLWNSCAFVILTGNVMHEDIWKKWRAAEKPENWKVLTKFEHTKRTVEYVALLEKAGKKPQGVRRTQTDDIDIPAIAAPAALPMNMEIAGESEDGEPTKKGKRKRKKNKRKKATNIDETNTTIEEPGDDIDIYAIAAPTALPMDTEIAVGSEDGEAPRTGKRKRKKNRRGSPTVVDETNTAIEEPEDEEPGASAC